MTRMTHAGTQRIEDITVSTKEAQSMSGAWKLFPTIKLVFHDFSYCSNQLEGSGSLQSLVSNENQNC